MMHMMHRTFSLAIGFLAIAIGGCASPVLVSGKVIQGNVSFIGLVDPADPRFTGPGLSGAEVTAYGAEARTGRIYGSGKSDNKGAFTLRFADQAAHSQPAEFHASLPGYLDTRQVLPVPPADRRLLIMLKPAVPDGR